LQIAPRYGIVRTRMGMSTRIAFWFGRQHRCCWCSGRDRI